MKKLLLILLSGIVLSACTPETYDDGCPSTCGTVTSWGADGCYWLEIRNECSFNTKTFCFSYDVWLDYFEGDYICVSGVNPW